MRELCATAKSAARLPDRVKSPHYRGATATAGSPQLADIRASIYVNPKQASPRVGAHANEGRRDRARQQDVPPTLLALADEVIE
jgi:hypothetical protein